MDTFPLDKLGWISALGGSFLFILGGMLVAWGAWGGWLLLLLAVLAMSLGVALIWCARVRVDQDEIEEGQEVPSVFDNLPTQINRWRRRY